MTTPNAMYASMTDINPLVRENLDLVNRIAYRLYKRLPDSVQVEDLIQSGMLGLLEAHERYNPDSEASFSTFAGIRIRGAMLDEIRRGDWAPRSVHRGARAIDEARQQVEARKGAPASEAELAAQMEISLDELRHLRADVAGTCLGSLDVHEPDLPPREVPADAGMQPGVRIERDDLCAAVARVSTTLPVREQKLIKMYYTQGRNMRQIAQLMGVSESRVCQLHRRAIARVRERLVKQVA